MPEDALTAVTDATFAEIVLGSRLPVLVDFWAEWCAPCRPMARTLADLAPEFAGEIVFATIDADANPEATRRYRVLAMPTLLLFSDGVVVHSIVGARPKSHLRQALTGATSAYVNR
jgi:thioredoxin 1